MNSPHTRQTAASLVRCPGSVTHRYFSNKKAHHPAGCAGQKRLSFQDLLELRVITLLVHTCRMSKNEAFRLSNAQARKLHTPYPLSDLRNLSEMKNVPEMIGRLLPDPEDGGARAAFKDAATVLIYSLDFHVNRPVRWNAGRDMNIARPGASVVIDPAVKDGVPTIMGTDVTTRAAAACAGVNLNQSQGEKRRDMG